VANDFITLNSFRIKKLKQASSTNEPIDMIFGFDEHGDDLNLWYVAVTRAKRTLFLPEKWLSVDTHIKETMEKNAEEGDGEVRGLQKLFASRPQDPLYAGTYPEKPRNDNEDLKKRGSSDE
jgi:ATP-dependent exoDNAse (exonuclease V) beta subunit